MITGADVLSFLIPDGGWAISGNDYENITFLEADPISKEEFEAGFIQYNAWKLEQDAAKAAAKATGEAKLEALGLTPVELAALGL